MAIDIAYIDWYLLILPILIDIGYWVACRVSVLSETSFSPQVAEGQAADAVLDAVRSWQDQSAEQEEPWPQKAVMLWCLS